MKIEQKLKEHSSFQSQANNKCLLLVAIVFSLHGLSLCSNVKESISEVENISSAQ
jgi:hypothetical protein